MTDHLAGRRYARAARCVDQAHDSLTEALRLLPPTSESHRRATAVLLMLPPVHASITEESQ